MKWFMYLTIAVCIIAAVFVTIAIVQWGVSLPRTALLWYEGTFAGWCNIVFYCVTTDIVILLPAVLAWATRG